MTDDTLDRYHELLLNDQEETASQNKIYGLKYSALIACFTVILSTRQIIMRLGDKRDVDYESFISITIAFIVSCYSSFIGHKKLFLGSFISFSICFVILATQQFGSSITLAFFLKLSRNILNIQIYIQICGQWPQQFVRVMVEMLLISYILAILVNVSKFSYNTILFAYLPLFPIILFLAFKGVCSFQQPLTKSVHRDIFKAIFHYKVKNNNIKPLIFTLLFASTFILFFLQLIYLLITVRKNQLSETEMHVSFITILILSACLLWKSRTLKQQSTLIFAIAITLLEIFGLLLLAGIAKIPYALPFYFTLPINVICYCLVYTVPQYQIILRSINIKNLDFASSYQQFVFVMLDASVTYIAKNEIEFIVKNINLMLPLSMIAVLVFGITFYQVLGFKQYFYKWNQSQVQEQELEASQI
ncbi:hypothetical protein pb186bvf_009205 [Paramecium bursaria]